MERVVPGDDLQTAAFKVATALASAGLGPVLTGGSAATAYAPDVYQSRDIDFVLRLARDLEVPEQILAGLGFTPSGRGSGTATLG